MKTEKRKAYIYAEKYIGGESDYDAEMRVYFYKLNSCDIFARALASEIEVDVPILSKSEVDALLNGAELEALIEARDAMRAEFQKQLSSIEDRISRLKCIESK